MRVWVKWLTREPQAIARIRERFGIPAYDTVNGLSPCDVSDDDLPLLRETARRGFISVIDAGWSENGGTFSFISR